MPDYLTTVDRDFRNYEAEQYVEPVEPEEEWVDEDYLDDQYERRAEASFDAAQDWMERYAMTSRASG